MRKLLISFAIIVSYSHVYAGESKMVLDRDVAQSEQETKPENPEVVKKVEHPESLQYDTKEYKKHKEYNKFIDRHYNK